MGGNLTDDMNQSSLVKRAPGFAQRKVSNTIFRLAILGLLLTAAGIGGFILVRRSSAPRSDRGQMENALVKSSESNLTFRQMLVLDGTTDGVRFSNQIYQSSDCVILNKRVELFESPKDAEAAFHTKLGTAIDVLQRGEKLDSAGNVVGERVLATLHRGGQVLNTVIWTRGSELHAIDSSSSNQIGRAHV